MRSFSRADAEKILMSLDEQSGLFPQFAFTKQDNKLKILGTGGFSSVYEMYNKTLSERLFALKVTGFDRRTISSAQFREAGSIQWILCRESAYIVRILDTREIALTLDDDGTVLAVKDATKEVWEENEETLHLQFVLMEKLDKLIEKDRFGKARVLREELDNEGEVLKLAFEVGQALAAAHTNGCLHRDVKLENVFWDAKDGVYKLGDFGMAKRAENGNAETVVYTDGYGAPEIERRLYERYNCAADIYSFGITLYLLLNDLKFPGSDGYYPKSEIQYDPGFVFPAPIHASEKMAGVLRKMCSFDPADRYKSLSEVFTALAGVIEPDGSELRDELSELADIATETFREGFRKEAGTISLQTPEMTRAKRKAEKKRADAAYRWKNTKYFCVITVLMVLLYKGLQPEPSMIMSASFVLLPVATLIAAVLQGISDYQLIFGAVTLVLSLVSAYSVGLTVPHVVMILSVLNGCPTLTLSASVSTILWMLLETSGRMKFLDRLSDWDLGWIVLIVLILVYWRYVLMRNDMKKTATVEQLLAYLLFLMSPVAIVLGLILFVLQKFCGIAIPDILQRMHLVRSGFIVLITLSSLWKQDGPSYEENDIS